MQRTAGAPRVVEDTKEGPVKVFALVTFNEDQALALGKYLEITEPLLKREGARIIERFSLEDDVIGHRPAKSVIIVEYPSRQAVDNVFSSPEYEAAIPYRDVAFATYSVHIAAQ
ncbi:DUF1330 domain-containing protein [Silicimonas sp. MF1-12-2]|uniref:DUF1330 domain-containing protein n=1 Tax=Silicimonas sp. MF1-12-2 TaxID=3384793 RepID=UPI0039B39097